MRVVDQGNGYSSTGRVTRLWLSLGAKAQRKEVGPLGYSLLISRRRETVHGGLLDRATKKVSSASVSGLGLPVDGAGERATEKRGQEGSGLGLYIWWARDTRLSFGGLQGGWGRFGGVSCGGGG